MSSVRRLGLSSERQRRAVLERLSHLDPMGLAAQPPRRGRQANRGLRVLLPHLSSRRPLGLLPHEGCGVSAPVDPPPEDRVQGCQWILRFLMVRQLHFAQFSYTKIPQVSTPFR